MGKKKRKKAEDNYDERPDSTIPWKAKVKWWPANVTGDVIVGRWEVDLFQDTNDNPARVTGCGDTLEEASKQAHLAALAYLVAARIS